MQLKKTQNYLERRKKLLTHNDCNEYTQKCGLKADTFLQQWPSRCSRESQLSHTSEFLLLLLSHPVDGEAGFSSQSPPQDSLVGLSLHVSG